MVPRVGIEPTLPKEPDFESGASTSFTTPAKNKFIINIQRDFYKLFYYLSQAASITAVLSFFIAFCSSWRMRSAETL